MKLVGQADPGYLSVGDAYALEDDISYMWEHFLNAGEQPKPVRIHSIRVSLMLAADSHPLDVVRAGLFHDLLEDTALTKEDLRQDYGEKIADIVAANSYGDSAADRRTRDMEMYQRCYEFGEEALLVKAADLLDNSYYFRPREGERGAWFVEKIGVLAKMSKPKIRKYPIWERLDKRFKELEECE